MRINLLWVVAAVAVVATVAITWTLLYPDQATSSDRVVQSAEEGGITITATWLNESVPGATVFRLVIDTHTVDLTTWDPNGSIRLESGDRTLLPLGAPEIRSKSSHHIELEVRFADTEAPAVVVVRDLGGVAERRIPFP